MPEPTLEPIGDVHPDPAAVVLVAHGGRSHGRDTGDRRRLAYWRMRPFGSQLERAGRAHRTDIGHGGRQPAEPAGWGQHGVAVYLLRYRYRGWNGAAMDAYRDAAWAVGEITRRHPGRPVALLGHSMGGRAVLRAAGEPGVVAVCALAPWIETERSAGGARISTDPVEQLAGRAVLIAHGDRERMTDPAASLDYAIRARRVTDRVARFDVIGDGHTMLRRAADWSSLVRRFVFGELGVEPLDPTITNAMREPAPGGLSVPLTPADQKSGAAQ